MLFALPNLLTYARIVAVPLTALLLGADYRLSAAAVFVAACITDYFDGMLARTLNLRSALGTMLDPIADKLLVAAVLLMLCADGSLYGVHLTAAILIICREILVSGLREYLAATRISMPVTHLAKIKTAAQMLALVFLLGGEKGSALAFIGQLGLWLAAVLTVYTGYDYLKSGVVHALKNDLPQ